MMKSVLVSIFILTLGSASTANIPAQPYLAASTVHGEKVTNFVVVKEKVWKLKMSSSDGVTRERVLKQDDVDFLASEFAKLPNPPQVPAECSRFQMRVTLKDPAAKSQTKLSCFGMKTLSEPAYSRFSKILISSI